MLIHVDSLSRASSLDEVLLSLLEATLVFQLQGQLEVHISHLVLSVLLAHLEGLLVLLPVHHILHHRLDQIVFQQHLDTLLRTQDFRPPLGQFLHLLVTPVVLADPNSLFP